MAATHHLLDGQQRSNAIALGFLNAWVATSEEATAALWLDLEAPAVSAKDDREFVFRVLTRTHPWGYRYQRLAEGGPRLTAHQIREATAGYRKATPAHRWTDTGDVPIALSWPWDAKAPVPVPLLIDAVSSGGDIRQRVLEELAETASFGKTSAATSTARDGQSASASCSPRRRAGITQD